MMNSLDDYVACELSFPFCSKPMNITRSDRLYNLSDTRAKTNSSTCSDWTPHYIPSIDNCNVIERSVIYLLLCWHGPKPLVVMFPVSLKSNYHINDEAHASTNALHKYILIKSPWFANGLRSATSSDWLLNEVMLTPKTIQPSTCWSVFTFTIHRRAMCEILIIRMIKSVSMLMPPRILCPNHIAEPMGCNNKRERES